MHRDAALASVSPEQRPIAEQVLKGGIPAVRQAIEAQNDRARAANHPEVNGEALLAMAEELLPRLKAAAWRDRAEAAAGAVDEISLRDLRSVVAGADTATRDDESRLLASTLREALERRVAAPARPVDGARSPGLWTKVGWCGPCGCPLTHPSQRPGFLPSWPCE